MIDRLHHLRALQLLAISLTAGLATAQIVLAQQLDDARIRSAGIRKLASRHLVLYTDLAPDPEIDKLPAVFDLAVPQWAKYFDVDPSKTTNWQARGFLIGERRRFEALGLMPAGNDQFVNGISMGPDLWFYDQPTPYYRRHLLLHEGTHVFMATLLGGCGPGWYMEGTAELLATHRLDDQTGRLTLRIMPRDRREVPMLGRIKLIQDAVAADRSITLQGVLQIDNRRQLGNVEYAWSWTTAKFLDCHPRYGERFRKLKQHVLDANFNEIVQREYQADWQDLTAEWQAFVAALDHDYDFKRMTIEMKRGQPLAAVSKQLQIAADRGWQSGGVWLEAGKSYSVEASGRYQIAQEHVDGALHPWPCEPGGVTIEYHAGRPLGMLIGAIVGQGTVDMQSGFAAPIDIGLGRTITPTASGTLYLRINDSAARLDDNRGTLTVSIRQAVN